MNEYHGDEGEIEFELNSRFEAYENEHADDWKGDPEQWGDL